ncbi:MAG: hypothetical protein KGI69_03855 [Patescibacteria group bacterium]|nr:hypothetical protein [Patescibacteria group bacterium]
MDTLTALFGSEAKVKMLRLFLFNPGTPFFPEEIAARTKCPLALVRKELAGLAKADIIKKRETSKEVPASKDGADGAKKMRGTGFVFNDKFPHLDPLKNLLTVSSVSADGTLLKRFAKAGRIKLLLAAGLFIQNWDSRVDLLIVGDELSQARIETAVRDIEAEIGKELAYSVFETQDFEYRLGMHDRLVRDILDYPHVTLLDRLGVSPE